MNCTIQLMDWEKQFAINFDVFSNYIPTKTVLCDYKDPPWMTDVVRTSVQKNMMHQPIDPIVSIKIISIVICI